MKFSILISSYNKGNYIEKCIKSCLAQSNKNLEIIVVDNYSSDETVKLLEKYSKNIIIKKKSKISKYPAANQIDLLEEAFKISNGEIICLLDADDYFLDNKVEKLKNLFSENKNINVIFDIPKKLVNEKIVDYKFKKKLLKYIWPTIYPTSCISLRRNFFRDSIEKKFFHNYPLLEIDFRITILSQMFDKKFLIMKNNNTIYRQVPNSIMSEIKKFSFLWWKKRFQAHLYLKDIFKFNDLEYKRNIDYYSTQIIFNLFKNFNKEK